MARKKQKRKPPSPMPETSFSGSTYELFSTGRRDYTDYSDLREQARAGQQAATMGTAPIVGSPGVPFAGGGSAGLPAGGGLNPRDFGELASIDRPPVIPLEEEVPQQNQDNSILGRFLDFMDNIVPDDMGGLIRGRSDQWLPEVPYLSDAYRNTAGAALGGALDVGGGTMDVLNWGSDQMNHLGAALFSALPGGIQTLDWEQAQEISMGQVVSANYGINSRLGVGGWLISIPTSGLMGPFLAIDKYQNPDNILYSDQFEILDPEMRKDAFESGGMGQFTSGFTDAVWAVAADPLIISGPISSVVRFGTKTGKLGGLTNQPLRSVVQIDRFGEEVLEQGRLIAELGVDGARQSGRISAEGENLIAAMSGKTDELFNHPFVQNASDKRTVQSLIGDTVLDRPEEAAALVGALAGHPGSWSSLRTLNADLYEATALGLGVNPFAPVGGNIQDFATAGIRMTPEQRALGDDIIYERLADRPDLVESLAVSGQLLTRGGARVAPRTVRAKNAWREGAARQSLSRRPTAAALASTDRPGQGHFVYDMLYGAAGSAPVRVVRWLGQGTPNGVVQLKEGGDALNSLDEFAAWMRKSPMDTDTSRDFFNAFAGARTAQDRKFIVMEAEEAMLDAIVASSGGKMTPEGVRRAYAGYNSRRAAVLEEARQTENTFSIDPTTGEKVILPGFYAELDQSFPLLNVKEFTRVARENPWLTLVGEGDDAANYLNSLWKISVLARLGYTQRNIAEGGLRSFAVLGVLAVNPSAFTSLPSNARYAVRIRRGMKKVKAEEKLLVDAQYELQQLRISIKALEEAEPQFLKNISSTAEEVTEAGSRERALVEQIDNLSKSINESMTSVRSAESGRRRLGRRENVMYDGKPMRGAFQDGEGSLALKASSADNTTYLTFAGTVGRRYEKLQLSPDFREMNPAKLTAKQMSEYFAEYSIRLNFRYRSDLIGRLVLKDVPVDDIMLIMRRSENKNYLKQMSTKTGRDLDTDQALRSYLDEQIARLNNEVPLGTGLREKLLNGEVTPAEISAALGSRDLPVIVGRVEDGIPSKGLASRGKRKLDASTSKIMRWLGTVPEDKLLRHPFYNTIYSREQERLYRVAAERGVDMSDNVILNRINTASHKIALKSTRETMYTIDRLSNAALMVRFISPFFPAWENAIRTWGRIAWTNPAVVGAGNIMFNIPNSLGWVVDKDGNRVDEDGKPIKSSFLSDEGNYVVWPKPMTDFLNDILGPFAPGVDLVTRQAGANVIFPGSSWLNPGVGVPVQFSVATFLRGKPEDAEILRNLIGDEKFRDIAPMGQFRGGPIESLAGILLPTFGRRLEQMYNGESSDGAYLNTWNMLIEDAYIDAQIDDRTLTEKDAASIADRANRFWSWQIAAAVVAPASSTYRSKFQVQRDMWSRLLDDSTLTYQQKIKVFTESFDDLEFDDPLFKKGEAFLPVTRSGTYRETNLQPNLTTWARITKNKDLVDKLYEINPELVGMFGNMGSFDDPFSYAVYGEYQSLKIGPGGNTVSRKLRPSEIIRNNEIVDGWSTHRAVKDAVEDRATQLGYSSLQVNDAEPLRKILRDAEDRLAERYPAWGQERKIYENNFSNFLLGARMIVENKEIMNEDQTVQVLAAYLDVRDEVSRRLDEEKNDDVRKQIKEIGYAAAFKMRQMDIGFADFYDQFLDKDDFRRV